MKISTQLKQGNLVIYLEGELDIHSAGSFRTQADDILNHSSVSRVILNMQGVSFIDSSGIGVIIGRYKRIKALNNGQFAIVNTKPEVARILELAGITKLIKVYKAEAEALGN